MTMDCLNISRENFKLDSSKGGAEESETLAVEKIK